MNSRAVALLVILVLLLCGCSDKLTEETARTVIEKEFIVESNSRGFSQLIFDEGSPGFNYFQKLIAGGSFKLTKEEKSGWTGSMSPKNDIVKTYSPTNEIAHAFKDIEVKNEIDQSQMDMLDVITNVMEKKEMPEKTVCVVFAKFKQNTVQSIDTILNDEKNGTARVKFTIAEVGITPYYDELHQLVYPGQSKPTGNFRLRKPWQTGVKLKKYDEGWSKDR
ncbi:MAG: hypothetical protein OCC46_02790 [Pseudodesulfovibrio sp.]